MAIDALAGPLNVFGQAAVPPGSQLGVAQDYNPHRGPSLFDQGLGIMDPRYPFGYQPGNASSLAYGWLGVDRICVVDAVPATLATAAVAAAANTTSGTAMTLVSSTGAGITVGASVVNALTGATVTGLLVMDVASAATAFGQSKGNNFWNPVTMLARAVSITGVSGGAGGAFKVAGYDVYGYPMNETITAGAGAGVTNGKKAFKYIASVTPQFTDAHNYSVDTTDIIGFPIRVDEWPYAQIYDGAAAPTLVSATTGFVAAVTTSPATATTGDVRGTYALQSASDGSKRLVIFVTPMLANIGTAAGLFGVTQF